MKTTHPHRALLAGTVLLLAVLACGAPTQEAPTASGEVGEASPTSAPPPLPTETPVPDISAPGGCTLNAAYVADVTVPDNTEMSPGESFVKAWRLRNSGTCDWEAGTVLVFSSGEQMGGPTSVPAGTLAAGATLDVSVNLTAPSAPGTYRGNWQMQAPDGTRFGSVVFVQIVVPAAATAAPTEGPTATPTQEPTPEPTGAPPPDLTIAAALIDPSPLISNAPFQVRTTLYNDGDQSLTGVTLRVECHRGQPQADCSDTNMVDTLYETLLDLAPGQSPPLDMAVHIDHTGYHRLCIVVDPNGAIPEQHEDNNALGVEVTVGTLTIIPLDANNSSSVREDGYTDFVAAQPGDASTGDRVHGFMSWDLSPIAGEEVLKATVAWDTVCFHGGDAGDCTPSRDPFPNLGRLWVRAYYYGTLDAGDFAAAWPNGGTLLRTYSSQPTEDLDVTAAVADALAAGRPFQVYMPFEYRSDNNGYYDGLRFIEGGDTNTLTVIAMP
jgi:hypothetical protein